MAYPHPPTFLFSFSSVCLDRLALDSHESLSDCDISRYSKLFISRTRTLSVLAVITREYTCQKQSYSCDQVLVATHKRLHCNFIPAAVQWAHSHEHQHRHMGNVFYYSIMTSRPQRVFNFIVVL